MSYEKCRRFFARRDALGADFSLTETEDRMDEETLFEAALNLPPPDRAPLATRVFGMRSLGVMGPGS